MLKFLTFVIEPKAKIMKELLLLIGITFSLNTFSQNNSQTTDWDNGIFNKRILKTHYSESQVDSLSKLLNTHIKGFYCYGGSCKYTKVEDDYYISIKMSNGYIKIKYYFTDFDVLKMDEFLPKIEHFLNSK
tara:strand:- start:288 stop:680 length:393 start_codon:yes stop_codon:yes gene_type:complete